MPPSKHPTDSELLAAYLQVCNEALARRAPQEPCAQILHTALKAVAERLMVQIIDDRPPEGLPVRLDDGRLEAESNQPKAVMPSDRLWRVPRSYLEEVVANAGRYLDNPATIDWEWLIPAPESFNTPRRSV